MEAYQLNVMFINMTLLALFSERQCDRVVKAAEKQCGNATEFLGSISHHANSFSML